MLSAVTDLPQPDSPTSPSVSPLSIRKLASFTAVSMPSSVANDTRRPLTSSNGVLSGVMHHSSLL